MSTTFSHKSISSQIILSHFFFNQSNLMQANISLIICSCSRHLKLLIKPDDFVQYFCHPMLYMGKLSLF